MQHRLSLEITVGTFVLLGVALLVFFLFTIGDLTTYFRRWQTVSVTFESANGISHGAPVQYAGVEVGKVDGVRIVTQQISAPQVEVVIRLPESLKIRVDDEAAISTFGLLGEKYVEITPGLGKGAILRPGEVLVGKPPVSTEQVIERSNKVLSELQQTLGGINSLIGDPQARILLAETLQEARDATRHWKLVGERLNLALSYVEAGQGSLGKLLYDEALYDDASDFVQDLKRNPWKLLARPKRQAAPDDAKAPSTQP